MTEIVGLNIQVTVGAYTVNRLPAGELRSERGAVAERLRLELPDAEGKLAKELKPDDSVSLFFGYRPGASQTWKGKITEVKAAKDMALVTALSPELAFVKTKVTECFHKETARQVVRRLLALAGVAPGRIEGPDEIIPHLIFSGSPVWECFRQINDTLTRVYEKDMTAMPFWIGREGSANWGDFDEPGDVPVFASAQNLVNHNPRNSEEGEAVGLLFPGLSHSRQFKIVDLRRSLTITKRAQSVVHKFGESGNLTTMSYGKERGYG
jgi:hypothetical protein